MGKNFVCIAATLWLFVTALAGTPKGYVISTKNAETVLTESVLKERIEYLSHPQCSGRGTGTPGSTWAIGWIGQQFQHQGLEPVSGSYFQGFRTPAGKTGHNVIGLLPGRDGGKTGEYILVTAHLDHLGILSGKLYPGADSNASGVAAMLSLSDMFTHLKKLGRSYGKGILFVALDGKEQGLSGSGELWRRLQGGLLSDPVSGKTIRPKDISLVVNIDQVGCTLSPLKSGRKDYLIMLSDAATGRRDLLTAVNRSQNINLELSFDYYGSKDFTRLFYRTVSDQKVFLEHGIPAVMFTSGITLNNNKPYDDLGSIDFPVLRARVLLMFHYLSRIA